MKLLRAIVLAGLLLLPGIARPAAPCNSFVYCLNQDGVKVFAGRIRANGDLLFGLSAWSAEGQNITVFGVANPHGRGWQYTENMAAADAADRCQLNIAPGPNESLRVDADSHASCQSHGGVNADIGTLIFPSAAYKGAVTTELDDPEAFQKAAQCGVHPKP